MSLGVLNNISAVYAENALSNTSNSLSKTLQQLSTGSRINSGADDAAGLSLVNGLQANQTALTQSQTNALEGVGLLQVADGALSQVTTLLNRAVTLATEAANGTLNATQDQAANQEYQSILAEINNIGATTTYNQQQVFGSVTNIYTGDSSTTGASVNSLNIRSLSSANVGDSGGVMSYSNGQNGVFLNLSSSTKNAQSTDTLNASGSSTIQVSYLIRGANGQSNPASTSITVGAGTNYANTADGLISAINSAGLGLSASFATQAQAGVAGGGTQTGIQISGGLVSVGVDPSSAATSGTLNPSEITTNQLTIGQTITVKAGNTTAAQVTLDATNNTLQGLAIAINNSVGGSGGVTANVVYNSQGVATSLELADNTSSGGALTVTTTPASVNPNASVSFTAGVTGQTGVQGTATLGITGAGSNNAAQALTGSIQLSNGTNSQTYVMGSGSSDSTVGNVTTLSAANSTLGGLAAAINRTLGASAMVTSTGISITSTAPGTNISQVSSTLVAPLAATVASNVAGIAASGGTAGSMVLSMSNAAGFKNDGSDALTGSINFTTSVGGVAGTTYTFTMGSSAGVVGTTYTTGTSTLQGLMNEINISTGTTGLQANITNGTLVVNSTQVNSSIATTNTLAGTTTLTSAAGSPAFGSSKNPATNVYSTVDVTVATGNPTGGGLTATGDSLAGQITITNNGVTDTFIMGAGSSSGNTFYTGANTMASLISTITGASNLGVTAAAKQTAGGSTSGLTLTANAYGTTIAVGGTGITDTSTLGTVTQTSIGNVLTNVLSLDNGGVLGAVGVSGTFDITEAQTGQAAGADQVLHVHLGTGGPNTATDLYIAGTGGVATMNQIVTGITNYIGSATNTGGPHFDFTASVDTNTGGLTIQAGAVSTTDTNLVINNSTVTAAQTLTAGSVTAGSIAGEASVAIGNPQGGAINVTDTLKQGSQITLTNSASGVATTFVMGGTVTGAGIVNVGTNGNQASQTVQALMTAINNAGLDLQTGISGGKLTITSTGPNNTGTITVGAVGNNPGQTNLALAYGAAQTSSTAGTGPSLATNAAVSINTAHGMVASDALSGQLILTNSSNGTAVTFNLNSSAANSGNTINLSTANSKLSDLVNAINSNATLGITASINSSTGALQLQSNTAVTSITVGGSGLTDGNAEILTVGPSAQAAIDSTGTITLASGSFATGNALGGSLSVTANGSTMTYVMGSGATNSVNGNTVTLSAANSTVSGLQQALNTYSGVTASISGGSMTLTSNTASANSINVTGNLYQSSASLSYSAGSAYNIGISNVASTGVYDSSTGQSALSAGPGAASANLSAIASGGSGVATISYSDGAGASLSSTNLMNQANAQVALNALNQAIADVAAQDGYIGAQINTLNAVSSVLNTQQQNIMAAQNAVQATDYAQAASNMSKYQILSQTGISALAQANSTQQAVLKLLQ